MVRRPNSTSIACANPLLVKLHLDTLFKVFKVGCTDQVCCRNTTSPPQPQARVLGKDFVHALLKDFIDKAVAPQDDEIKDNTMHLAIAGFVLCFSIAFLVTAAVVARSWITMSRWTWDGGNYRYVRVNDSEVAPYDAEALE